MRPRCAPGRHLVHPRRVPCASAAAPAARPSPVTIAQRVRNRVWTGFPRRVTPPRWGRVLADAFPSVGAGCATIRAQLATNTLRAHPQTLQSRLPGASTIRIKHSDAGICDPDMTSPPCKSSGRAHRVGPSMTLAESTGAAARSGLFNNIPADTTGARIRQTAGNPARRLDSPQMAGQQGRRATRRRRFTDQRNTARTVPAASARTQRVRRG